LISKGLMAAQSGYESGEHRKLSDYELENATRGVKLFTPLVPILCVRLMHSILIIA
jgi:hypothetical protein